MTLAGVVEGMQDQPSWLEPLCRMIAPCLTAAHPVVTDIQFEQGLWVVNMYPALVVLDGGGMIFDPVSVNVVTLVDTVRACGAERLNVSATHRRIRMEYRRGGTDVVFHISFAPLPTARESYRGTESGLVSLA